MGEVFRAYDTVLAREVAIKVLHRSLSGDPGFVDRFRREARAAAGLSHPNIVAVHDWGAVDGVYFMVMEHVRGRSLREILSSEGLLAPAQAAEVLLQVLAALEHAHRQGIVHRDVKPENVMVTRDGIVKVADFGLARAYADSRVTQAGTVSGTVQYLAPEQLEGEPADPRTDLYAVGILAFELMTGRVPFTGETSMAIAYKHVRDRVPRPSAVNPAVPEGLDGWVSSMTEKARELRPESAEEARRDLAAEAKALPPATPIAQLVQGVSETGPGTDPHRAPTVVISHARTKRRRRTRWIFGIVIALLALAAAAWGVWTYLIPHYVDVPQVIGISVHDAETRLNDSGLTVRLGKGLYSTTSQKGTVISVEPKAGTRIRKGSSVTLVRSLGPPPVPVPNVVSLALDEARKALAKAHFVLHIAEREYSDTVAEGSVTSQGVPFGEKAPKGSSIDVVVSKGPTPKPVPRVIGKTQAAAETLLEAWTVDVRRRFSDTVARGTVVNQRPLEGVEVQPGDTVVIFVSLGPRTFPMPNVVGMSKEAAVAKLRTLGLHVGVLTVLNSSGTTVVSQIPSAGVTVQYGQTVTIYVA
jgi:beta-lactam-binding protein with PASTA domain